MMLLLVGVFYIVCCGVVATSDAAADDSFYDRFGSESGVVDSIVATAHINKETRFPGPSLSPQSCDALEQLVTSLAIEEANFQTEQLLQAATSNLNESCFEQSSLAPLDHHRSKRATDEGCIMVECTWAELIDSRCETSSNVGVSCVELSIIILVAGDVTIIPETPESLARVSQTIKPTSLSLEGTVESEVLEWIFTAAQWPSVQRLTIDGFRANQFSEQTTLSQFNNLRSFSMEHSRLVTIHHDFFSAAHVPSITTISIPHNSISDLPAHTFSNLTLLQSVDLQSNAIVDIDSQALENLPSLMQLLLQNNRILEIKQGTFSTATNLVRLLLNHNKISSLQENTFQELATLRHLDVSFNAISVVGSGTFDLPQLTLLTLSSNSLTMIDANAFTGSQISRLLASNNQLSQVDLSSISGTLTHLGLSSNLFTVLPITIPTPNLERLIMKDNPLASLGSVTLGTLVPKLTDLDISYHLLPTIRLELFGSLIPQLFFAPVRSGQHCELNTDNVDETSLSNLKMLDLSNVRVGVSVYDLIAKINLTTLAVGFPDMEVDFGRICSGLHATVDRFSLQNTRVRDVALCEGTGIRFLEVDLMNNDFLTTVSVDTVSRLNVSNSRNLVSIFASSISILDISSTNFAPNSLLCQRIGTTQLYARNLLNRAMRSRGTTGEWMDVCSRKVDILDIANNLWFNRLSVVRDVMERVSALSDETTKVTTLDFVQVLIRKRPLLLELSNNPIDCTLEINNAPFIFENNQIRTLPTSIFTCSCTHGYTQDGENCTKTTLSALAIAGITAGSICIMIVFLQLVMKTTRFLRNHFSLVEEHSKAKDRIREQEEELTALHKGWEIDFNNIILFTTVASGATGEICKGKMGSFMVAVKISRAAPMGDDEKGIFDTYFQAETAFLQKMKHRNLVHFLGMGTTPTRCRFIVLEFVEFGSMLSFLKRDLEEEILNFHKRIRDERRGSGSNGSHKIVTEPMRTDGMQSFLNVRLLDDMDGLEQETCVDEHNPFDSYDADGIRIQTRWDLKVSFAKDIVDGMRFLTDQHCLHRDLKGDNVLISLDLRAKITDFGTIQGHFRTDILDSDRSVVVRGLANDDEFVGTIAYMSPETLQNNSYNEKTDVFSYGVVLWEIAMEEAADLISMHFPNYKGPYRSKYAELLENGTQLEFGIPASTQRKSQTKDETTPTWYQNLAKLCWSHDPHRRPTFSAIHSTIVENS
eukprot:m.137802 g.137802  ORF g.137802 m.137802 type:complete len:1215 (+) comp12438_c0_seq1:164-3808(+)